MRWRRGEGARWGPGSAGSRGMRGSPPATFPALLHLALRRLVNEEYKVWKKNTPFLYGEGLRAGRQGSGGAATRHVA